MNHGRGWREVKAEARRLQPEMDNPELWAAASARLDAYVAGHHLKELRKSVGKSQAEVAAVIGVPQSRVSQIENGDLSAMGLDTLRGYARALGGRVDITVSVGPHSVKVG